MGRHSAPDDDEGTGRAVMTFTPVAPNVLRAGRHARPEEDDAATDVLERPVPRPAPRPAEAETRPHQPRFHETRPPETRAPETRAPETRAPETRPSQTQPPGTRPPETRNGSEAVLAEQETARIPLIDEPVPGVAASPVAPPAEPPPPPAKPRFGKGDQSSAADLALLRKHSALRARVIAAVVAPFILYTAVMYLTAWWDVYFIWVWIPLVTAGVVAGSFLDAAHRRNNRAEGAT